MLPATPRICSRVTTKSSTPIATPPVAYIGASTRRVAGDAARQRCHDDDERRREHDQRADERDHLDDVDRGRGWCETSSRFEAECGARALAVQRGCENGRSRSEMHEGVDVAGGDDDARAAVEVAARIRQQQVDQQPRPDVAEDQADREDQSLRESVSADASQREADGDHQRAGAVARPAARRDQAGDRKRPHHRAARTRGTCRRSRARGWSASISVTPTVAATSATRTARWTRRPFMPGARSAPRPRAPPWG